MSNLIWKDDWYPDHLWILEKKLYNKKYPHIFKEVDSLDFIKYPNFIDINIIKLLKYELFKIHKIYCIDKETLEYIENVEDE